MSKNQIWYLDRENVTILRMILHLQNIQTKTSDIVTTGKNLEAIYIALLRPRLNHQLESNKLLRNAISIFNSNNFYSL